MCIAAFFLLSWLEGCGMKSSDLYSMFVMEHWGMIHSDLSIYVHLKSFVQMFCVSLGESWLQFINRVVCGCKVCDPGLAFMFEYKQHILLLDASQCSLAPQSQCVSQLCQPELMTRPWEWTASDWRGCGPTGQRSCRSAWQHWVSNIWDWAKLTARWRVRKLGEWGIKNGELEIEREREEKV